MKRRNVIIIIAEGLEPEAWSNFRKMCLAKGLPYHSLKGKKIPVEYKGKVIYKKPVQ